MDKARLIEVFDDFKKDIGKFLDYLESDKQFGK